jgi:hypothetical protein
MYMLISTETTSITAQLTGTFHIQEKIITTSGEMTMPQNILTGRLVAGIRALVIEMS